MGKWAKAQAGQVSQQFLQNQQRRKQMILQAVKRRKQKQRKLQQQMQQQKIQKQQCITKHKQQKQDAYIKYLRNNMHDKYQQMKYNKKIPQQQLKVNKWKKNTSEQKNHNKQQNKNNKKNNKQWDMEQQDKLIQKKKQGYNNSKNNNINSRRVNSANNNTNQLQSLNLQVNIDKRDKNIKLKPQTFYKEQSQLNKNKIYNLSSNSQKNVQIKDIKNNKRRMLQDEFQKQWEEQNVNNKKNTKNSKKQQDIECSLYDYDDLIGSKLLDSLDLDFQTVSRGRQYNKKLKQSFLELSQQPEVFQNKQVNQIKNMIGYQSVLMSIDERSQMIKKYNQLMVNQVEVKEKAFGINKNTNQVNLNSKNDKNKNNKKSNQKDKKISIQKHKNTKPINQGEVFNELKNNKQGKILNWANQQAEQAQDLFSNCSTNKKANKNKGMQLLKQINKEIQQKKINSQTLIPNEQINMKKKQAPLESICQKNLNKSKQRIRQRSYDKNKVKTNNQPAKTETRFNAGGNNRSTQRISKDVSQQRKTSSTLIPIPRPNKLLPQPNNNQTQSNQPIRKIVVRQNSKQRINKAETNSFKQNINVPSTSQNRNKSNSNNRSLSKQKQNKGSLKQINPPEAYKNPQIISKQQIRASNWNPQKGKTNSNISLTHLPPMPTNARFNSQNFNNGDQITIATQDQVFQIQSFIKNQLLTLNKQQRQVQQELKNLHIASKQKIKQIKQKYQIKTDYKHSKQLVQGYVQDQQQSNNSKNSYKNAHKKQTQDQLQQSIQRLDNMLLRKQLKNDRNQVILQQDNQSQSTSRSIINPMTDPITLHKQVLQLAQNLSRFQGQPSNIQVGYGAKLRIMQKKKSKQKSSQKIKIPSKQKNNNGITYYQNNKNKKQYTQIGLSQSQDVNYSQLNSQTHTNTKQSKVSKVSRPPKLDYFQNNNISPNVQLSDLLDDQLEDSISKGKIQVNQRLRKMLLE